MEVAAYLSDKASSASVVGNSEIPFQQTLGPKIGKAMMKMLEDQRVKFYMKDSIIELRGEAGKVKEAVLKSGAVLPVDVLVCGIGVRAASGFLRDSGINLDSKGAVLVDKFMQTNVPGVFAAGDVTSFPLWYWTDQRVSIGHWQLAQMHGYGEGFSEVLLKGKVEDLKFVAFYIKEENVAAVASMNSDPVVSQVAEFLSSGRKISKNEAVSDDMTWLELH
nr:PREDICTED: apoptosis-inducing factor 3-like isoform X2 [Latimeria chalumnae]|eukprot:XP_014350111.1 PREDICTED: apoptosis-inducing factor 3-like isoform X2 [Latimeria chalumnae]